MLTVKTGLFIALGVFGIVYLGVWAGALPGP